MAAKPIPDGYNSLNPYLVVDDATRAIEFYKQAFDAKERGVMAGPEGKVMHAELEIGDSVFMLGDHFEQSTVTPPKQLGGTGSAIFMYVEDVDAVVQRAEQAGGNVIMPVQDMFWGDRYGKVADPFGHEWQIATRKEDLSEEEMMERAEQAMAETG